MKYIQIGKEHIAIDNKTNLIYIVYDKTAHMAIKIVTDPDFADYIESMETATEISREDFENKIQAILCELNRVVGKLTSKNNKP